MNNDDDLVFFSSDCLFDARTNKTSINTDDRVVTAEGKLGTVVLSAFDGAYIRIEFDDGSPTSFGYARCFTGKRAFSKTTR